MRNRFMWLVVLGFVFVTTLSIYDVPTALSRTVSRAKPRVQATPPPSTPTGDPFSKFGVADYLGTESQSLEASELERRRRISKRYDNQQWVQRNPHPETAKIGRFTEKPAPAVIPAEDSDLVVVGKVVGLTTHLSNDKGSVYSEFKIRVQKVLKNGVGIDKTTDVITVDREGGVVRYPNSQMVLYEDSIEGLPEAGQEYLLFLKGDQLSENYQILTGYELKESNTVPLDKGRSTDDLKTQGKSNFIRTVEEKLSQANRENESGRKP